MSEVRNADLSSLRIQRQPEKVQTPRPWGKIITAVVIVAALIYGWRYFSSTSFSAVEIEIASASLVSPSQFNSVLNASGYVVAQRKASVSSKVAGRLVALNVIEGDVVKQNQIIGRIESADVEATLSQLRAALDVAKADVENALAEKEDAQLDLSRKQSIFDAHAITRVELDVAKARERRATASHSGRLAAVKMAEANIRNAEVQVENTILRAPFDGTVLSKNANVGEVITALGGAAGSRGAVVTVADMNSLEVEADVSESNIQSISQDQACEISLDSYPGKRYRAFVSKIIPTADRAKATVQVKVRFQERDERVLPEMSAKVLFLKDQSSAAAAAAAAAPAKLMIPSSAVHARDAKNYVFVFTDDRAKEVEVQVASKENDLIEITQGISAGTKVIVKPAETIKDGTKVQLKK